MNLEEAVRIEVRNGRMEAFLIVSTGLEPELLDLETCKAVVRAEGILLTSQVTTNVETVVEAYIEDPSKDSSMLIATGSLPEAGLDGFLEWEEQFDPDAESNNTPVAGEDGKVDYYSTTRYRMATEGDHIANVREATLGRDGVGVDGAVIPTHPGRSYKLRTDATSEVIEDGAVIAKRSGLISFDSNYLRILNILEVPGNVDFATGNIEFDGSVVVQKSIRDCFQVTCSEELTVHGLIEAAHLVVDGNASFNRGMAGREKGTVQINGTLEARYLEGVNGRVCGDLVVAKEIVNCDLVVGRSLSIQSGALIGGCTRIGKSMELDVVGSPAGVPTVVSVGDIPELTEALANIEKFLPTVEERLEAAQSEFAILKAGAARAGPAQRERITEVQFEVSEWQRRHSTMLAKREEILTTLNQHARPMLTINKRLHTDSVIILRNVGVRLKMEVKGPIQIELDSHGEIMVTDLTADQKSTLVAYGDPIDPLATIHAAENAQEKPAKAA